MISIKKFLILILIYPTVCFSQTINMRNIENKYNINYFISDYSYIINTKTNVESSFSLVQKGCSIELNKTSRPILLQNKSKDFEFTFLHEISHCVLGKDIFYNPIEWKISISLDENEKIKNIIKENEDFYLKNKHTPLIKVIYHEIFADTLASIIYIRNNSCGEKDLKVLLRNRIQQNKNPYDSHLSVSAIRQVLKEKEQIKNLTIDQLKDKAIEIAQNNLLQYIRVEYE